MNGKEATTVRKLLRCLLVFSLLFTFLLPVQADGYRVVIEDQEDLLSEAEEAKLKSEMEAITAYGHAAFVSVKQYGATDTYVKETYMSLFGNESGILFVIDMGQRNIWIMCNGEVYRRKSKLYRDVCILYRDGSIDIVDYKGFDPKADYPDAWQIWQFGPSLINDDGTPREEFPI